MLFLSAIIITIHKNIHRLIPYTPGGYEYVETGKKTEYTPPYRDIGRITLCSRVFSNGRKDEPVRTKADIVSSCEAMVIPVC